MKSFPTIQKNTYLLSWQQNYHSSEIFNFSTHLLHVSAAWYSREPACKYISSQKFFGTSCWNYLLQALKDLPHKKSYRNPNP